ncbi:MAG: hypothetical protein KAY24_15025, partial [Candidatus Eisenbacteria sp.]|nr:hypothetical protein [Candidatus Eisenbacteria bacterium]
MEGMARMEKERRTKLGESRMKALAGRRMKSLVELRMKALAGRRMKGPVELGFPLGMRWRKGRRQQMLAMARSAIRNTFTLRRTGPSSRNGWEGVPERSQHVRSQ